MVTEQGHGLGRIPDTPDDRDYAWRDKVIRSAIRLPKHFKRARLGPVLDQGSLPYCVAYSSTSLKMHEEYIEHKKYYNFDPDWLYARCKEIDGYQGDGTYVRCALQIMQETGHLAHAAPKKLDSDTYFKIGNYVRLNTIEDIKQAIYTVGPVLIGSAVDDNFEYPDESGIISGPGGRKLGGHAYELTSFDDRVNGGSFLLKNSWGKNWSIGGYAWIPYDYLNYYNDWDAWQSIDLQDPAPMPVS